MSSKKHHYFKTSKYRQSEFKFIESDLQSISKMGKIINNANSECPLVIFNTESFGLFEYKEKSEQFNHKTIIDEENLAEKMPKNFKTVFIGNETYFIAGGFDSKAGKTSKHAYYLARGKI